jgi:putative transposon-encoded protein
VRVTLVWTDPPGSGNPALVNNLDLTVNVGGNVYRGNVFTGGVSTTGGSPSTIDNVENVFLPAGIPAGTTFSISVSAVALNGDGILGNADTTDQHFSLVGYNFEAPDVGAHPPVDFDGDRKTDVSIFRDNMHQWWVDRSSDGQIFATGFGAITEPGTPVPADFDGDGKADVAVWRSDGLWFITRSGDNSYYTAPFGAAGDIPVPADYDGDQRADLAIFRPSTATWYIQKSAGGTDIIQFGLSTDVAVPSDFDGDGKADIAIVRPSNSQWWINRSSGGLIVYQFGASGDRVVPGDYTGDGKSDVAFWRPSNGSWYILRSEDVSYYSLPFGNSTDKPVPGDYDGDGKFDTAVFRPASATWFVDRSTAGLLIKNFGISDDRPLPNVFVR